MTADPDQQPHPPETFGCHYGCEFFSDSGVLSPEYCKHPSFEKPRKIIGFSSKSCEIPRGKTRPEWCPLCGVCAATIAAAARTEEREKIAAEQEEEYLLNEGGFVKCDPSDEPCEECGKKPVQHYTHLDPQTGECDSWRCPDCARKWIKESEERMRRDIEWAEAEVRKEVLAEGAREERERVLNKLQQWFSGRCSKARPFREIFTEDEIIEEIESLRSQQPKEP